MSSWAEMDGSKYYFDSEGYRVSGNRIIGSDAYEFAADGVLVEKIDGVFKDSLSGYLYFADEGAVVYGAGLVEWDGGIYYVRSNGRLATTEWYVGASALNGLAPSAGTYQFGSDGRMQL